MSLSDRVSISRRFLRSIRIESDLGNSQALEGFVCPQSIADILMTMARHVSETGQGAFTWTGPYGSGKSSLVVALSALLNGSPKLQKQAVKIFGARLANKISKSLPPSKKGWRFLPVMGQREKPVRIIGDALNLCGFVSRKPRGGWTENKLIDSIVDISEQSPKAYGGLIVFVDEMGKFLEAAVQDGADIYVFQRLAEAAARSNGRLIIVGILHQAFEEYAQRLSHEMRDEWAKIQGRFIDLPINVTADEQIDLISRAIESERRPREFRSLAKEVSDIACRGKSSQKESLAFKLERCWPLHPIVAGLLGPISRRRFGQNQRSIFGFLNSAEPHGFQDFLRTANVKDLYYPDRLWDYLRANLEPSILASPDGHRWALAVEALERCESVGGDGIHIKLLKTIAVIDLFKERSGLVASFELLRTCFSTKEVTDEKLKEYLVQLEKWSFTLFKKFLNAHSIFAGSDFDIDQAVREALEDIDEIDFEKLTELAGLHPILAKRHYHGTGALRWFDVNLAPINTLSETVARYKPDNSAIGQFILAIPTEGENEEYAKGLCQKAACCSDELDILIGISSRSWSIASLARELVALENIRNDRPELVGDSVARREIVARMVALQEQLEAELSKAFDNALWFRQGHDPRLYRQVELNSLASGLAEIRFCKCPKLKNELLNRQKPSGSAVAARNILLRQMILNEGEPRLGIDGFPAEGGLFVSLLEYTKLYSQRPEGWQFVSPSQDNADPCRLAPIWKDATDFIKKNRHRSVLISEIYDLWRKEPFGVKDGLLPVLAVAFILSQKKKLAIYRDGIFRARFDDVDVEYLAKDSTIIQLRWMDMSDIARRLLSEMADVVRELDKTKKLVNLEPIDVARGLISIYEDLPQWTKRTTQLSTNAMQIRDLFKRARDPNQFLFDDIPAVLGVNGAPANEEDLQKIVENIRDGLKELVQAYPSMLHRLRDIMLAELQVPNISPQSLEELRKRANNVRQLAGDFHLEAFVGRLSQFDGTETAFEGIASLAASKPPRDWVDPDLDRAAVDIADMAQKFLRAETYTRVKGRPEKRHAIAVMIGMDGRPSPFLEEFDIADADRAAINDLVQRITTALSNADIDRKNLILAALAELSVHYMKDNGKKAGKRKKVVS